MLTKLEIEDKPFTQFILILSLCLVSVVLFSIIGTLAAALIYSFNPSEINNLGDPNIIEGMKLIQLFSAIGLFIIPPITYGVATSKKSFQKLSISSFQKPINYLLILVLMIVLTPFISWVIEVNANMVLPDFMSGIEQWMRDSEHNAEQATKAFLTFNGIGSLLYILLIVAIVPAIGEELLFRGVLQKIFINWSKNAHLGIWVSAILFSALHMQFFGFFPRLLLGILFGYIFYWSKSLWVPILGHFINNGVVVVISYLYPEMVNNTESSIFGEGESSVIIYIGSFIISAIVFFLVWKVNSRIKHV
ncbi:MAG: CPBP family intramembrane metalloprotease [Flavobacteriales bacterium]|nr:CPBP family intramembrane metalloprotease [Flavobacteriales bacterium]